MLSLFIPLLSLNLDVEGMPEGSGSPFSFFRYVFITREHYHSPEAQEMLMHELGRTGQGDIRIAGT